MVTRTLLAAAIALMASAAQAEPLEFSSADGPALNIARNLMVQERGEAFTEGESVSVALIDLDGDGTRDIFAFADSSYFCGSAGCIPRLYRLEASTAKWLELPIVSEATINGEPPMWTVGDPDSSGWRTLEFRNDLVTLEFHWDGEAYVN
jgi:hypothetical protein